MDIERLLKRVKTGDSGALRTLYDTYTPLMREICATITKADAATIDDLVQESFILAYYSLDQLREASKFKSWITAITRNVALKHVERGSKMKFVSFSAVNADVTATNVPTADSVLSEKEIQELINKLPAGYGKVLRMTLDGFSHKEIADELGIEPHSSSSQLARAKAILRHAINKRTITIIALAIMSLPLIKHFFLREEQKPMAIASGNKSKPKPQNASGNTQQSSNTDVSAPATRTYAKAASTPTGLASIKPDTTTLLYGDTTTLRKPSKSTPENALAATEKHDSTANQRTDAPVQNIAITETGTNVAEESTSSSKHKWQLLAAGSLGPALAQNVYALISNSIDSGTTDPDGSITGPTNFGTWDELRDYLISNKHANTPADTLALIDIAANNRGSKIVEHEHHDKPITIALSATKTLGKRWSMATGLQYSLLKSTFTLGEGNYYIKKYQKAHYLGIPLQVSYKWLNLKKWEAYSSAGLTLNVPLHGKTQERYVTGASVPYSSKWHFTPPVQWSVGANVGLQYKLNTNWGIYAEPTFNWHIPNGSSTHTIWTEHPISVTVPFGVRYTW
jgi:RNA polymerase sigma-70 factor (ECF subfamily)